jgi:hypothetical protein
VTEPVTSNRELDRVWRNILDRAIKRIAAEDREAGAAKRPDQAPAGGTES